MLCLDTWFSSLILEGMAVMAARLKAA